MGANTNLREARFTSGKAGLLNRIKPKAGSSLRFAIEGEPHYEYIPCWEVALDQTFTCLPTLSVEKQVNEVK